jgi:Fic family protein
MTNALTTIERARGFLEAAQLSQDWLKGMQNKMLLLEAYHTTHIEGAQLTLEQSEKLLAGKTLPEADPDDVKELLNYREAFDLVAGYLGSGEAVTEGLIREIHKRLVLGVRGNSATPGKYRLIQNYVANSITKEVIYTPPPAHDVPFMMQELLTWLNSEHQLHPVLISGISQFQFVHIHPFIDGNGRTARLLSTLCLYQKGYDFRRLFTISEYYDRNRTAYYRALQSVRENNMEMTVWLDYFTTGLANQLKAIRLQGEQVIKMDLVLSAAAKAHLKERPRRILKYLMEHGRATGKECEQALSIQHRTVLRDLKVLVEKGFAREVGSSPTDPTKYYEPVL